MSFKMNRFARWHSLCLFLLIALLAACGANTGTTASSSPAPQKTTAASTAPSQKNCLPASPIDNSHLGPEAHGTGNHAELWTLIESTSGVPPLPNTMVKMIWRMTGSGDFNIVAIGPSGVKIAPSQGPTISSSSSWIHPGDEWGTGFSFPSAGCWDLHATRANASGDVWLKVSA